MIAYVQKKEESCCDFKLQESNQATLTGNILFDQHLWIKATGDNNFLSFPLFTTARARTEQSYGQLAFCLQRKKEVREIQNKQTRHVLMSGRKKKKQTV